MSIEVKVLEDLTMRTFVHLSDTHVLPADADCLHGVDTFHNALDVLQMLSGRGLRAELDARRHAVRRARTCADVVWQYLSGGPLANRPSRPRVARADR